MATEKREKGRTEKEKLTGVRAAAMERRRAYRGRSNLPAMSRREAAAASSTKVSDVVKRRRRREVGRRRRSSFSVPRFGGEVQETGEQRRKTMMWGKKQEFTPAALFIYRQRGSWGSW
jgi:hypothetical protein